MANNTNLSNKDFGYETFKWIEKNYKEVNPYSNNIDYLLLRYMLQKTNY